MTILLWTPRIGKLTCEKDPHKEGYYKSKLDSIRDSGEKPTFNSSDTPLIAADFNGWHYEEMQEVVSYCMENDLNKPDFVKQCVTDGLIKEIRGD